MDGDLIGRWADLLVNYCLAVEDGETIAVGSDADIVVFDPDRKVTISAKTQHSKTDYNLYEGTEVTGTPEVVLLRGQILVEGDELVAEPGIGQFVRRAKFGEELKPAAVATA